MKYNFNAKEILGEIIYIIDVEPPYQMLYDLSSGFLQTSVGVEDVIKNIGEVVSGKADLYSFGGSDYCIIDVRKDTSSVQYDFGENETQVSTNEILELLNDWLGFLKKHNA